MAFVYGQFIFMVSCTIILARPPTLDFSDDRIVSTSRDDHEPVIKVRLLNCDPCLPGWGVKWQCNGTSNTICTPCTPGSWSPKRSHFRQCTPCSKCGNGLYEDLVCTITRDTRCDSCANVKGHYNEDYKRKCDWHTVPESLKLANEESDDDKEDYQDQGQITEIEGDIEKLKESKIKENADSEDEEDNKDIRVNPQDIAMLERVLLKQEFDKKLKMDAQLDEKQDDVDKEDEDNTDEDYRKPILRPMAQMEPARSAVSANAPFEDSWEEESAQTEDKHIQVNYPPSYHRYPVNDLMHHQSRIAYTLIALTGCIIVLAIIFAVCYVREHRDTRRALYKRVAVVRLSPEEKEIVRQSANRLHQNERNVKRFRFGAWNGYKSFTNSHSNTSLAITENPLDAYLESQSNSESLQYTRVSENVNVV